MIDWNKLITWVCMEGTLVDHSKYNPKSVKKRVQFKLSKPEKISSLIELLEENTWEYTFVECKKSELNILQPYYIRLYGDLAREVFEDIGPSKLLPQRFLSLSKEEFIEVLKIIEITDGTRPHNRVYWSTTEEKNFNLIRKLCNEHNIDFREHVPGESAFDNGKKQYKCSFKY